MVWSEFRFSTIAGALKAPFNGFEGRLRDCQKTLETLRKDIDTNINIDTNQRGLFVRVN